MKYGGAFNTTLKPCVKMQKTFVFKNPKLLHHAYSVLWRHNRIIKHLYLKVAYDWLQVNII